MKKPDKPYVCRKHGKLTRFSQHIVCWDCGSMICVRCGRAVLGGAAAKKWLARGGKRS